MTTRTITGTILDADDNPVSGVGVSFVMNDGVFLLDPDETYMASGVTAITNTSGVFSIVLAAGLPITWSVRLPGGDTFVIAVPEGSATTLEELRAAFNGQPPNRVPPDPPTLTDFTNAQHEHTDAASGGLLPNMLRVFNATDDGAVGDDVTDNTVAIAAARTRAGVHRPITLPLGDYNDSTHTNLYGSNFKDALGAKTMLGTTAAPATRVEPIQWIEKITASEQESGVVWDQGALYAALDKRDGDTHGAAITGYGLASGGESSIIGIHGRAVSVVADVDAWGMWAYVGIFSGTPPDRAIGLEVNVANGDVDTGWSSDTGVGDYDGIVVATADTVTSGIGTHAIAISKNTGSGWHTGLKTTVDAIVGTSGTAFANGEVAHFRGGSTSANKAGGVRFGVGHFQYGLSTQEATIANNAAVFLADSHKIVWDSGSGLASAQYLTNISGNFILVGGATTLMTLSGSGIADLRLNDSGAAANSRNADMVFDGGDWELRLLNDNGTIKSTPLTVTSGGAFSLIDGITAPTAVVGRTFIYVDTADGDLKVRFGDGTTKTISTDT